MIEKIERSSLFLMANLGSEISKIFSAKEKSNKEMFDFAISKAKSIINDLKKLQNPNPEINILSDIVDDFDSKNQKYRISSEHLKSYFYPFAMRLLDRN